MSKQPVIDYNNPLDTPFAFSKQGVALPENMEGKSVDKIRSLDALNAQSLEMQDSLKACQDEVNYTRLTLGMQPVWLSVSAFLFRTCFRLNPELSLARRYFSNPRVCQLLSGYGAVAALIGGHSLFTLPTDVTYWQLMGTVHAELQLKNATLQAERQQAMADLKIDVTNFSSQR